MAYIKIGNKQIDNVRFAITDEEQETGLMHSSWPPDFMVFPYKTAEKRKFWMKNTPVPLDIIFCKANKIIYIGVGKPYVENKLIGPNEPCDLVIEAYGGFCAYNDIKIGDSISVKYDKENIAKLLKK